MWLRIEPVLVLEVRVRIWSWEARAMVASIDPVTAVVEISRFPCLVAMAEEVEGWTVSSMRPVLVETWTLWGFSSEASTSVVSAVNRTPPVIEETWISRGFPAVAT